MIACRPAEPEDLKSVIRFWSDSFKRSPYSGCIPDGEWSSVMLPAMNRIIDAPGVSVAVACNSDGKPGLTDLVGCIIVERGWLETCKVLRGGRRVKEVRCSEVPAVHYCYVKLNYRKEGYAKSLFEFEGIGPRTRFIYTCRTEMSDLLRSKMPLGSWNRDVAVFRKGQDYASSNKSKVADVVAVK